MLLRLIVIALIYVCVNIANCQDFCLKSEFMSHINFRAVEPGVHQEISDTVNMYKWTKKEEFDERAFFKQQIEKIIQNKMGSELLLRLCILLEISGALRDLASNIQSPVRVNKNVSWISFQNAPKLTVSFAKEASVFSGGVGSNLSNMNLCINLNLIGENVFFHESLNCLCTLIPCLSYAKGDFAYVSSCADPFWMLIAHELIHMEHFLRTKINDFCFEYIFVTDSSHPQSIETQKERLLKIKKAVGVVKGAWKIDTIQRIIVDPITPESISDIYKFLNDTSRLHSRYVKNLGVSSREAALANRELLPFFPELEGLPLNKRNHVDNICPKLEERQTVIGPDISELTIRLDGKMPIRYIYQDPNYFTYERIDTILKIVNASMSYHKNQLMTKEDLIRYIANPDNDFYFNSRYFVKRPRHELLSEKMISELNITRDTSVGCRLEISSGLVEKKSTTLSTRSAAMPCRVAEFNQRRINRIIDAYSAENFKEVEKNLFFSRGGVKSIDPNLAKILTDRFEATEILRNINSKLREHADYELSLLQPLIDLFKEIKTREFPE